MAYEAIPDELKELPQWCCFELIWDEKRGKYTKIPMNAFTGEKAKSNDETTWATFEVAQDAVSKFKLSGIGKADAGRQLHLGGNGRA